MDQDMNFGCDVATGKGELERMVFIPEEYELPLFLFKRIRTQEHKDKKKMKWCDFLQKHLIIYEKLYGIVPFEKNSSRRIENGKYAAPADGGGAVSSTFTDSAHTAMMTTAAAAGGDYSDAARKKWKTGKVKESGGKAEARFQEEEYSWKLPPNRFKITQGDISENVKEASAKPSPIFILPTSKSKVNVPDPIDRFYNLSYETNKEKRPQKSINVKIRRERKVQEKTQPPGPADYSPQSVTRQKSSAFVNIPSISRFYDSTTVPVNTRFFQKEPFLRPTFDSYDPTRISCICKNWKREEKTLKSCPCDRIRSIPRGGHRYLFKPTPVQKIYTLCSIRPKKTDARIPIQINYDVVRDLHYNTIEYPRKRIKLRKNKRICFLSGQPRFKDVEYFDLEIVKRKPIDIPRVEISTPPTIKRKLEDPIKPKPPIIRNKKPNCFQPIPTPKSYNETKTTSNNAPDTMHLIYHPFALTDFIKAPPEEEWNTVAEVEKMLLEILPPTPAPPPHKS